MAHAQQSPLEDDAGPPGRGSSLALFRVAATGPTARRAASHQVGFPHRTAKALLRRADKGQEGPLGVVLGLKTPSGYGLRLVSRDDRVRAKRAADPGVIALR